MRNPLRLHTSEWESRGDWLEARAILPEWGIELLKRRPGWITRMPKAIAWLMRLTGGTVQYRVAKKPLAPFDEQMMLIERGLFRRM